MAQKGVNVAELGALRRQQTLALLEQAGAEGLSAKSLAAALAVKELSACAYARRANAVRGFTRLSIMTRWFHPSRAAEAAAYVAAANAQLKGDAALRARRAGSDARTADMLRLLDKAGAAGETREELAKALGVRANTVSTMLGAHMALGEVCCRFVREGNSQRRYWLAKHLPPLPVAPIKSPRKTAAASAKGAKPAPMSSSAEPIYTKATKVTVCPTFTDNRFTPTRVEPFFSAPAMTPGVYPLRTGSAIERAYT